jgi:hypothetical protein
MAPDWRSVSKPSFQMTTRAASILVFADRCEFPSRLPRGVHFMRRRTPNVPQTRAIIYLTNPLFRGTIDTWKPSIKDPELFKKLSFTSLTQ